MTPAERMIHDLKVREYHRMLMSAEDEELRNLFDETMPAADRELRMELSFVIRHLRNLVWMYGLQVADARQRVTDPEALRSLDFCLAFDDCRLEKLDESTEARFADMRARAWRGLLGSAAEEKKQRETGTSN
jgi:hypothetical protein